MKQISASLKKGGGLFRAGFILLIVSLILLPFYAQRAKAAALSSMSDTLTRLKISTTSDHEIKFLTPTGVDASTDTIIVTFASAFATSTAFSVNNVDMASNDAASCSSGTFTEKTLAATASSGTWGVAATGANGQTVTFTAPTNAASGEITANRCVRIRIGTNATTGASGAVQYTNPSSAASYTISISGTFGDTGSMAVSIITDDQVAVSATVDPSITFSLSANTVALGTLSSASVSTGSVIATTSTNSLSGFTTTVLENNNLRIDASNDIGDVADGFITAGSEEYGIATTDSGQTITTDSNCSASTYAASAITSTAQSLAGATSGPVTEANTICLAASITTTTTAGSYSHTLTFVSTATF